MERLTRKQFIEDIRQAMETPTMGKADISSRINKINKATKQMPPVAPQTSVKPKLNNEVKK